MSESTVSPDRILGAQRSGAGTIKRIRLENFMCHGSLEIELCEWVNFITGQNGSGKSAILTALCIAFGCRAKETQRASKLKDFIKTGCSYAVVQVTIKNEGVDAFRPEIYGDSILIERRITESTSSTFLKDRQGRKVANRREDLRELVEHFNIDVENPCVIMSQDKSREFLHSGNDKDKFKVDELLQSIRRQLTDAYALVDELESSIRPIQLELRELQEKIKNMERVEEISRRVQQLKKLLAWLLVYEDDQKLLKQTEVIETLKNRIPACRAKIDTYLQVVEKLQEHFLKKKVHVSCLLEKTSELKRKKYELEEACRLATKEKFELEKEHGRHTKNIQSMLNHVRILEEQAHDIQEKHIRDTQAEESEIEEQIKELDYEVDLVKSRLSSLKDEENSLTEHVSAAKDVIKEIDDEIKDYERKRDGIDRQIRELRLHQTNRVTAFGGDGVLRLLREIERHHHKFTKPPIGPIGAHVALVNGGDTWAPAVEQAIGSLLNAFIVTNSNDASALRKCAREARYNYFPIIIHNFSRPRLNIPDHSLPQTKHPTTLSVLHSDNPTVFNVLVDSGKAERQVLVKDYNSGKTVAFDERVPNLREVYTLDGFKMFSRGSVQTILPSNKRLRIGRLCGSFDDQIKEFERHGSNVLEEIERCKCRKRELDKKVWDFENRLRNVKRRRIDAERDVTAKSLKLQDVRNSCVAQAGVSPEPTTNELLEEISNVKVEIQGGEALVVTLRERMNVAETKARSLELSHKDLCESTKGEIEAFEKAEEELTEIERKINDAEARRAHYESVMNDKVLPSIKEAEAIYVDLENSRKESYKKASVFCPENEIKSIEGWDKVNLEELNAEYKTLKQRLQQESQRYSESIDDLRTLYHEKENKILRKVQIYNAFRGKLDACQKALDLRWNKFERNASYLKRQLTWKFNGHLGKKGISGNINVSYEEKILSVEVKMPQDASSSTVRDTRGLSGGERSFSTLCFALSLHEMTEAPFRAMDEFDVFMDAVSRKISLDTLVEFALAQGSQWIFITPHDISGVKQGERIRKQQTAPPRT